MSPRSDMRSPAGPSGRAGQRSSGPDSRRFVETLWPIGPDGSSPPPGRAVTIQVGAEDLGILAVFQVLRAHPSEPSHRPVTRARFALVAPRGLGPATTVAGAVTQGPVPAPRASAPHQNR